jgi:hypothetical protein
VEPMRFFGIYCEETVGNRFRDSDEEDRTHLLNFSSLFVPHKSCVARYTVSWPVVHFGGGRSIRLILIDGGRSTDKRSFRYNVLNLFYRRRACVRYRTGKHNTRVPRAIYYYNNKKKKNVYPVYMYIIGT